MVLRSGTICIGRARKQKTDGEYADDLKSGWMASRDQSSDWGPAAASFIAELRNVDIESPKADNDVEDGIRGCLHA